jgi:hypothetical protein
MPRNMARRKKQNVDPPQENPENADDTFGLPEIEYEPLKRDTPAEEKKIEDIPEVQPEPPPYIAEEPVAEKKQQDQPKQEFVEENQFYQPSYSYTSHREEKPAIWPKVLGVLALLLVAGVAIWYFAFKLPEQRRAEDQVRRDRMAAQDADKKKKGDALEEQRRLQEEQQKAAATKAAATPPPGTIETLSGRSGRYYVVVASSIDGDLIMDYAKKLSSKGVTSRIIPPFGKAKFHRLTVADGDTYANAQATADGMKGGDYGDKIWVIKY